MAKLFSHPLVLLGWISLAVMVVAYLLLTGHAFMTEYRKAVEDSTSAKNFYHMNCARDEVRRKVGVTDVACRENQDLARRSPLIHATVVIASQWTLCGPDGCRKIILEMRDSLLWMFAGVVVIVFLVFWCCGMNIFHARRVRDEINHSLPSHLYPTSYPLAYTQFYNPGGSMYVQDSLHHRKKQIEHVPDLYQ